ncbi:MAG: hypothetical protein R3C68_11375 [Myxococcota bacterium]
MLSHIADFSITVLILTLCAGYVIWHIFGRKASMCTSSQGGCSSCAEQPASQKNRTQQITPLVQIRSVNRAASDD